MAASPPLGAPEKCLSYGDLVKVKVSLKVNTYSSCATSLTATETRMPYGITMLPASTSPN